MALVATALLGAPGVPGLAQVIEDFEAYEDTVDLQGYWRYADLDTAVAFDGTKSLRRTSASMIHMQGMFTFAVYSGPYLDVSSAEAVRVFVRRDPSSVDVQFRLLLIDSMVNACGVFSPLGMNPGEWVELRLDLSECTSVDLTEIEQIKMYVTNQSNTTGPVAANYDRVELVSSPIFTDGFETGDVDGWAESR